MPNTDSPFGFKPVETVLGASWSGKINSYYVPATDAVAMFKGDAVKSAGSADPTGKYPSVTQATAGAPIRGVVIGFGDTPYLAIHPDAPMQGYRPASIAMYAFVVDDPFVIFEIQEDSVGNSISADMVGLSTNIVVGAGSTASGKSGMELDSSDTGTDVTGQCKLLRAVDRADNELGNFCKWHVTIIEHEMLLSTDV